MPKKPKPPKQMEIIEGADRITLMCQLAATLLVEPPYRGRKRTVRDIQQAIQDADELITLTEIYEFNKLA